jgi:hypothetical protein
MKVQCQVCKVIFNDGISVWERCRFTGWESKVKCPECIAAERPELIRISCYDTGHHQFDQKLLFPQWSVGIIWPGFKGEAFANQPIRKFIQESCCGSIIVPFM